jgi:superfamily II DNA or RNA helicase
MRAVTVKKMDQFVEFLKEEVLAGVWSKGVQMSRAAKSIELLSSLNGEWKFKIQTTERLLAFQVTLWPEEEDSHCNCGSKIEPCHHIVAVALAYQNGLVKAPTDESLKNRPRLDYFWKIDPEKGQILFKREFKIGDQVIPIPTSLVGLIGGIQSGRIKSPMPPSTTLDLKIDDVLNKSVLRWNELLPILRDLPPLKVQGLDAVSELNIRRDGDRPSLMIDDLGENFVIRTRINDRLPEFTYQEGLAVWKNEDGAYEIGLQSKRSQAAHPKQLAKNDPEALEVFLRETLPELKSQFEVEVRAPDFPELVEVDPILTFKVHALKDGKVSVTGGVAYPPTEGKSIARRNLELERALHRQLKQDYQLNLDQPMTLSPEAAFSLRTRTELRALDSYLSTALQNLGGLSIDQALAKPSEVLHLLRLKDQNANPQTQGAVSTLAQTLRASFSPPPPLPSNEELSRKIPAKLVAVLRDYQKQGVKWLIDRAKEKSGAILADDMGLGKTLQTLCAIQTPAIIVVPTSLTHNWVNEVKQFRPELKVNLYHGAERKLDDTADITLTTYGVLRQDAPKLLAKAWASAVLDEAHLIRNPDTQAAVASFQITANFKLALTGTPIQNRTRDLWSLFQFIAPGLFGSESEFTPSLVAPFILRRTKDEVLTELPPKTYLEHSVELSKDERATYESVLAAAKTEIVERYSEGEKLNPLTLFEMLLRARQTCDHPGLFDASKWFQPSSKLEILFDLLDELIEAGHSVLVFSQWTKFLDRITEELKQRSKEDSRWKWLRLDGATQNRSEVLEQFQTSKEPRVFLLSLHAGGVGLNLTKADHVVFCDPWWNPFVEFQAEDRAYRMGQDKPVTIHRLLCENSVEERIRLLQQEKKKLGQEWISAPELSKDDLKILLD